MLDSVITIFLCVRFLDRNHQDQTLEVRQSSQFSHISSANWTTMHFSDAGEWIASHYKSVLTFIHCNNQARTYPGVSAQIHSFTFLPVLMVTAPAGIQQQPQFLCKRVWLFLLKLTPLSSLTPFPPHRCPHLRPRVPPPQKKRMWGNSRWGKSPNHSVL